MSDRWMSLIASSIPRPLVYDVLQRLTVAETLEVGDELVDGQRQSSRRYGRHSAAKAERSPYGRRDVRPAAALVSNTSSAAPRIRPDVSAAIKAASSTTRPRLTLMKTAEGFIAPNSASPSMPRVSRRERCCHENVSRDSPQHFVQLLDAERHVPASGRSPASGVRAVSAITRMPKACARRAVSRPMPP